MTVNPDTLARAATEAQTAIDNGWPAAPVTLRDFLSPGAWADRQAKRAAVRAVLAEHEPSMVVSDELLDDLIGAADAGF